MGGYEPCPICGNMAQPETYNAIENKRYYNCPNCGQFFLKDMLYRDIDIYEKEKDKFYKVSSWIYEQNNSFDTCPEIDKNRFEELLNLPDKKIKEKFDFMVQYILNNQGSNELLKNIKPACWIKDDNELGILLEKAINLEYVAGISVSKSLAATYIISINKPTLTFDGLEYVESLEEPNSNSKQVFAAFYFSDEIKDIFDNYVKEAVEECGLTYARVSSSSTAHDTTINDEIISKINSSRLVIADFTDQRNSVYFEAGYAMGMRLPVIWTCKKDDVDNLSFDTRQYPHILWESGEDLKKQLIHRIKATI